MTLDGATILRMGVRTITILYDGSPGGDRRYHLSATIDGRNYPLGRYDDATALGRAMLRWLRGRGMTTALGSARRLSEAQRLGSHVIVLDIEPVAQNATIGLCTPV